MWVFLSGVRVLSLVIMFRVRVWSLVSGFRVAMGTFLSFAGCVGSRKKANSRSSAR